MKKLIVLAMLLFAAAGTAFAFAGLRVVVVPPEKNLAGRVVIATGLQGFGLIDSPKTFCLNAGDTDPTCPISALLALDHEGKVLIELPYIDLLHRLSGAARADY